MDIHPSHTNLTTKTYFKGFGNRAISPKQVQTPSPPSTSKNSHIPSASVSARVTPSARGNAW